MSLIANDVELECTQERIAFFSRLVANMHQVEKPENFKYIASGYLAEIDKMHKEGNTMKTLEQQIQELTDREEIKELTAHYAHGVARGEGARVSALFTDDGVFINRLT